MSALGCVAQELPATLVGTVNDSLGSPIENAKVHIDSDAINVGPYSVRTDNLGQFRFADIPPETYHLEITVPGFITWRKAGVRLVSGRLTSLPEAFLTLGCVCGGPSVDFIQRSSSVDETGTLRGSVLDGSG